MPRVMSEDEVKKELAKLNGWKLEGSFITKELEFKDFIDGIRFVDKVAKAAEKLEHHPDIHVRYTHVTFSNQTHSEGGVTKWDISLARQIDKLAKKSAKKIRSGRGKSNSESQTVKS
jgi:4a-hydroxytetrahydrobiopterin dehydratase